MRETCGAVSLVSVSRRRLRDFKSATKKFGGSVRDSARRTIEARDPPAKARNCSYPFSPDWKRRSFASVLMFQRSRNGWSPLSEAPRPAV